LNADSARSVRGHRRLFASSGVVAEPVIFSLAFLASGVNRHGPDLAHIRLADTTMTHAKATTTDSAATVAEPRETVAPERASSKEDATH
jgi:hypothetical protein